MPIVNQKGQNALGSWLSESFAGSSVLFRWALPRWVWLASPTNWDAAVGKPLALVTTVVDESGQEPRTKI